MGKTILNQFRAINCIGAISLLSIIGCFFLHSAEKGTLLPIKINGKWGYADESWQVQLPPVYDSATLFYNNRALIRKDGCYRYIDRKGSFINTSCYLEAYPFQDNLSCVFEGDKYFFIDTFGNYVVSVQSDVYGECSQFFSNGLNFAKKDDENIVFIDKNGRIHIETEFPYTSGFYQGVAKLWNNERCVYINTDGVTLIEGNGIGGDYSEGLISYVDKLDGGALFINKNGVVEMIPEHRNFGYGIFNEGFCAAIKSFQKIGFIDRSGQLICAPDYERVMNFQNGMAAVMKNGKWGFIDQTGKLVIPAIYDQVFYNGFLGNYARVEINKKSGYIDKAGQFIWTDS